MHTICCYLLFCFSDYLLLFLNVEVESQVSRVQSDKCATNHVRDALDYEMRFAFLLADESKHGMVLAINKQSLG
jgi:hypothetical protein